MRAITVACMQVTLRAARDKKGWSVDRLAAESRVHKATIYRLESGENLPTYGTVTALETALGLKRGSLTFSQERISA